MKLWQRYLLKIKYRFIKWFLLVTGKDFNYAIGVFHIRLPAEHALPRYQALYPTYDTFLSTLAVVLPDNSYVVDVGANCGDSAAALLTGNASLNLVCIEADSTFFKYLRLNSSALKQQKNCNIIVKEALVGQGKSATLIGDNGTRKAVSPSESKSPIKVYTTLDETLVSYNAAISLIKVDVDGYDYDVLNSATLVLSQQHPLVFFEFLCTSLQVLGHYKATLSTMAEQGYCHWWIFDNFGALVSYTADHNELLSLQANLLQNSQHGRHITCEYFDVLAACDSNAMLAQRAVSLYVS